MTSVLLFRLMFVSCRLTFFKFILRRSSTSTVNVSKQFDPCTGCEIPCSKHVAYPAEILAQIDQCAMTNSVEKHHRHLCVGQSFLPSQWPKDVKNLQGNYLKELTRILNNKKDAIGYSIKLTSASISSTSSSSTDADWYLFPDQLKVSNVNIEQIDEVVEKLFVQDPSIIQIKNSSRTIDEQHSLPKFSASQIQCERLTGLWILVCCHSQRDERCGKTHIRSSTCRKSFLSMVFYMCQIRLEILSVVFFLNNVIKFLPAIFRSNWTNFS